MSDLAWAVKNGDMEQVKEMVETKVRGGTPAQLVRSGTKKKSFTLPQLARLDSLSASVNPPHKKTGLSR